MDGRRSSTVLVSALASAVFAASVALGSHAASGADSYGYVSQARLWSHGRLTQPEPLAQKAGWPNARATLAPLGYRPAAHAFGNVPTYSPGLPILMALVGLVGGPCAYYLVVPLCTALIVWLTYRLGLRVSDPLVAAGSAVLMAASPTLLFMMMWPMSDVPVSAFWLAALVCAASHEGRGRPFATAILAGTAILIRPNLAPLAIVPLAFSAYSASQSGPPAMRRAVLVASTVLAGFAIGVAVLNIALYGSALESGYGALSGLYAFKNVVRNAPLHWRWLLQSQGVYVTAALIGLVAHWRRGPRSPLFWGTCLAALAWLAYLPYHVYFDWWYLRFLLPAFPVMFLLMVDGVAAAAGLLGPRARIAVTTLFVIVVAAHGLRFASRNGVATIGDDEHRYVEVGVFVATAFPANAVFVAGQHSGSLRYYAGRPTLRYDRIELKSLDLTVHILESLDLHPYAVLEPAEERTVREWFSGQSTVERLNAAPITELDSHTPVRIYDLQPEVAGPPISPRVRHLFRGECLEPR